MQPGGAGHRFWWPAIGHWWLLTKKLMQAWWSRPSFLWPAAVSAMVTNLLRQVT